MGFLPSKPSARPHFCQYQGKTLSFPEGTRWQCDTCGKVYRVQQVMDRNDLEYHWVEEADG